MKTFMTITLIMLTNIAFGQNSKGHNYLSISHEVNDYQEWKIVFDEFSKDRKNAGISDLFVKKDINNPNLVTVFSKITNLEKAKNFMTSPNLKDAMQKAGVVSQPIINFYTSSQKYKPNKSSGLTTIITHSVSDVSSWKRTYDASESLRSAAGISDNLVLVSMNDANVVTVMGSSSTVENFENFLVNPELQETMKKAGVTSKPEVQILL